jgi:hypothetical protein
VSTKKGKRPARHATRITPQDIAALVGQGGEWTRQAVAAAFDRPYSTHIKTLCDQAYAMGLIQKYQGIQDDGRHCWVYAPQGTQPRLFAWD